MPLFQSHKYFAFISYSHKDAVLARQMEKTFTRFNLPSALCEKYPQKPKKIRPVFRDLDDMKSGELTTSIEQALRDSKYLIVICSKYSAKENDNGVNWIDNEVKTFIRILANNLGLQWGAKDVEKYLFLRDLSNIREKNKLESAIISFCMQNAIEYSAESLKKWSVSLSIKAIKWDAANLADFALLMGYSNYGDDELRKIDLLCSEIYKRIIPVLHRPDTLAIKLGIKKRLKSGDCMPPTIKKLNFLTYNTQKGKYRVFSDVIATMLGLRLDELWDRYGKWLRFVNCLKYAAAGIVALIMLIGGAFSYDYYIPHVCYYADYVEQDNRPVGITPLNKEQVKNRQFHYKITTHKYKKFVQLECCNSQGYLTDAHYDWESSRPVKIVYDVSDGKVTKSTSYTAYGEISGTRTYYDLKSVNYRYFNDQWEDLGGGYLKDSEFKLYPGGMSSSSAFDVENPIFSNYSAYVARVAVERDSKGRIIKVLFQDYHGDAICNEQGAYGKVYKYDDAGRITGLNLIDEEGANFELKDGVSGYSLTYREDGTLNKMLLVDKNCMAKYSSAVKFASVLYEWENGNKKAKLYLDEKGTPCMNKLGFSKVIYCYDEKGNCHYSSVYNDKNEKCCSLYGYHAVKTKYHDNGYEKKVEFYNAENKLCIRTSGNIHGEIETPYDNVLCGIAGFTMEYDKNNMPHKIMYYGVDNKPLIHPDLKTYGVSVEYPSKDVRLVKLLDSDGAPLSDLSKVSILKMYMNKRGKIREIGLYNAKDLPLENNDGIFKMEITYNHIGDVNRIDFFDKDKNKCNRKTDGVSYIVFEYSESGRIKKEIHYNLNKNKLKEVYYDENEKMSKMEVYQTEHNRRQIYTYNERNQITSITFLNEAGEAVENESGVYHYELSYDKNNQHLQQEIQYDSSDKMTKIIEYFPENKVKKEISFPNEKVGTIVEYNSDEKVVKLTYINEKYEVIFNDKEGASVKEFKYDTKGRLQKIIYVISEQCRKVEEFNENGQPKKISYYNGDEERCVGDMGFSYLELLYDNDKIIEERWYDVDSSFIKRFQYVYTEKGCKLIEFIPASATELGKIAEYDESSRIVKFTYVDENWEKRQDKFGKASVHYEYNQDVGSYRKLLYDYNNVLIGILEYDKDGRLYKEKVSIMMAGIKIYGIIEYDGENRPIVGTYVNDNDEPCVGPEGYTKVVVEYGEDGAPIKETHYDLDNNIINVIRNNE